MDVTLGGLITETGHERVRSYQRKQYYRFSFKSDNLLLLLGLPLRLVLPEFRFRAFL